MADVLAIISKAQFESEFPTAKVADVLPITEYRSVHKALDRLSEGGSLFLVTVRPPDERLWLVAVLDQPKKGPTGWKAKNARPVRDISDLRARLRFENGKGIAAKPGALGMSLQTPRALSHEDVALLRGGAMPVQRYSRHDLQLETWRTLDRRKRDELVAAIAAAKGLTVVSHEEGEGQARVVFRHQTGVELALIPGGRFQMGLNDAEQRRLLEYLRAEDDQTGAIRLLENPDPLRPVHDVDVAPFLLAVSPAPSSQLADVDEDDFDAEDLPKVARALKKHGLRLPSEAEWEYACRGGFDGAFAHGDEIPSSASGANGFGVVGMGATMDVCEDGYHPSYTGAPSTSAPWKGKARVVRGGAEPLCWDGPTVWMLALAAARATLDPDEVCVSARPAMSLFDELARETPVRMLPAKRAYRPQVNPVAAAPVEQREEARVALVAHAPVASEEELLARVRANPSDRTARFAYGHALFARGDARGEYLVALEAGDERRAAALLAEHLHEWVAPIRAASGNSVRSAVFKDGFVDAFGFATLDERALDAVGCLTPIRALTVRAFDPSVLGGLLARHHVRELEIECDLNAEALVAALARTDVSLSALTLFDLDSAMLARVLRAPGCARLESLSVRLKGALDSSGAEAIAALPLRQLVLSAAMTDQLDVFARMTSLETLSIRPHDEVPEPVANRLSGLRSTLRSLSIDDHISPKSTAALLASQPSLEDVTLPTLQERSLAAVLGALVRPRAVEFELGNNHESLGADGLKLLMKAKWSGGVRSLSLSSAYLGDDGARLIGDWDGELATLDISVNQITARGMEALTKGRGLRAVRSLRAVMNPYGSGGATALSTAGFASDLRELSLFSNRIGAPGLRALLAAMPRLEALSLKSENSYRDEGLKLAAKGALPNVRELYVEEVSPEAIDAWLESGHADRLERLFIGNSTLSRRGAERLTRLPKLGVLHTNFVTPGEPGALDPISARWWPALEV